MTWILPLARLFSLGYGGRARESEMRCKVQLFSAANHQSHLDTPGDPDRAIRVNGGTESRPAIGLRSSSERISFFRSSTARLGVVHQQA